MITDYSIHYSCLPNHVFIWACDKFVAIPMLKLLQLKANRC